jgi:hypothetical protein
MAMNFLANITLAVQYINQVYRVLYIPHFPPSLGNIQLLSYNVYIKSYQDCKNNT